MRNLKNFQGDENIFCEYLRKNWLLFLWSTICHIKNKKNFELIGSQMVRYAHWHLTSRNHHLNHIQKVKKSKNPYCINISRQKDIKLYNAILHLLLYFTERHMKMKTLNHIVLPRASEWVKHSEMNKMR